MSRANPTERDLDILARTLYGEAEAGNAKDAIAIASVVMNRVDYQNWPNTATEVCLQPYQFSCWNLNDPNRERILAAKGPWFDRCRDIAADAVTGKLEDPTHCSTHYYATYVKKPKWAKGKKPVYEVEHRGGHAHLFFNNIDTKPPQSPKEALDQQRPVARTRTMAGGGVALATGGSALGIGLADQITQAAPAVTVAREVAETAQNHPSGLLIVFGIAVIAAALFVIWARWDDRRKGLR